MHCRCPHCHNPVEIIDDQELSDISCPSCGSNFHLVSGKSSLPTIPYEHRTIAHFELLEQAGVGGFGAVWKARDTNLDRIVAVKLPRTEALTESQQSQFFKEARAAAQIKHPNIVSVHEVGRTDKEIYIVSDYINGATLSEWIKAKPLSNREAAKLSSTIADALHAAHEVGVIHRDLKPANVLMDLEGKPHIADFGLAKRDAGEITMTMDGQILGTPAYMSPEQAKGDGHNADRRSDVYSLGVILYQLLTGELPFRGDTRMLIVQILQDEPTPPRKLSSQVPRDLETICLKCLSKEPQSRYQSANDFKEDLQRFLAGNPIDARPPGILERSWKWITKNQTPLMRLTAIILTFVTFALSALTMQALNARNREKVARQRADTQTQLALTAQKEMLAAKDNENKMLLRAEQDRQNALRAQNTILKAELSKMQVDFVIDGFVKFYDQFKHELGENHASVRSYRNQLQTFGRDVE